MSELEFIFLALRSAAAPNWFTANIFRPPERFFVSQSYFPSLSLSLSLVEELIMNLITVFL